MVRKRPCSFCRQWFWPDARVGARQKVCSSLECQAKRRKRTQAAWRAANPDYFAARRLAERVEKATVAEKAASAVKVTSAENKVRRVRQPTRMPPPLDRLPWDVAQDALGPQGADFIQQFGRVLVAVAQDQRRVQPRDTS